MKMVFLTCKKEQLRRDIDLVRQLKSASVSVMNNIAEGFGRYSDKEFIRFLDISQSSAQEVLSMTYVLIDMDYVNDREFRELQSKIIDTRNLVLGLIKYLRGK